MSVLIPTTIGGCIAVSDSDALETLSLAGLPPGTRVFNADVGHFFRLVTCVQRTFDIDAADTYAAGTFDFANGDFTAADEGNSLVLQLVPPNAELAGIYTIDNYVSATEIDVLPATDFTQTLPMVGNLVVIENALETDVTVAALGTIESVWRLDTSDADVQSVTGDGIDNADPANPVFAIADAIDDDPDGATAALDGATHLLQGAESAADKIIVDGVTMGAWAGARRDEMLVAVPELTEFNAYRVGHSVTGAAFAAFTAANSAAVEGGACVPSTANAVFAFGRIIFTLPKTGKEAIVFRAKFGTPTGTDIAEVGLYNAASSHAITCRRKADATDTHWGILSVGVGTTFQAGTIAGDNLWHNIMLAMNGTNVRLFIDNVLSATLLSSSADVVDDSYYPVAVNTVVGDIIVSKIAYGYIAP